ncbi:VWA domain-containing protein [Clostridium gasigenes]|uniref:vWA domain-containing protein n=1 Tax=Clostridium gasigenes TaxID=94869 RepID=UPI001626C2B8|nr:vWA domain-containing protein [Clostridium gasigenes]MBB6624397.1 VWA domain-containing protein [Clostridium gasigenes]
MKKYLKSILIACLTIVFILEVFPMGNYNKVKCEESPRLTLKKEATKISDDEYKIELTVDGPASPDKTGTDIIIVMDSSGSMKNSMALLNNSIKNFCSKMLKMNNTRISVIDFDGSNTFSGTGSMKDARIITETTTNGGFESNYKNIANVIDTKISVAGATNTQAAIRTVKNQLIVSEKSRPNVDRYVVFFTDGIPTTAIGESVVNEDNRYKIENYIKLSKTEFDSIDKKDTKFISLGLLNYSNWQNVQAHELLNYIQNSGFKDIQNNTDIDSIYTQIRNDIVLQLLIAKNAVLTDIVSKNFEIIPNSNEPSTIPMTVSSAENTVSFNIDEITTSGTKVSFRVKTKNAYYANNEEPTNDKAVLNYNTPKTNSPIEGTFNVPIVKLEPIKGSITIIKEVDKNGMEPPSGDTFTVKLHGGKSMEEYNFDLASNSTTKVDVTLKDKDTTNLIYPYYLTIGEYDITEIIPMNYTLKEIYVNGTKVDTPKFTINKDNPNITIKLVNKYDNDRFFTDTQSKENQIRYNPTTQ